MRREQNRQWQSQNDLEKQGSLMSMNSAREQFRVVLGGRQDLAGLRVETRRAGMWFWSTGEMIELSG